MPSLNNFLKNNTLFENENDFEEENELFKVNYYHNHNQSYQKNKYNIKQPTTEETTKTNSNRLFENHTAEKDEDTNITNTKIVEDSKVKSSKEAKISNYYKLYTFRS